jgi:hypothetical protein
MPATSVPLFAPGACGDALVALTGGAQASTEVTR